jgi:hypothetical protein
MPSRYGKPLSERERIESHRWAVKKNKLREMLRELRREVQLCVEMGGQRRLEVEDAARRLAEWLGKHLTPIDQTDPEDPPHDG